MTGAEIARQLLDVCAELGANEWSGLPVIFFNEVELLRGKTPEELKVIGMIKAVFPTARVLQ